MAKESYISKINNTKIFAERAEYTKGGKNIDNMVEKVASATSGNLAAFDANGGLVDSNQAAANLVHDASYVHTDSNFTVAEKNKLNGIESGAQVNVIETVKVNGTTQTVTSKAIDISVPTAGTSNPSMDGTASAGSATTWSKSDHVHPTDTSREATANKDSSIPSSPVSGHYPSTEAVLQFVNSSISTNTANFLGTYDVVTDLGLTTSATNAQIASALNSYTFPAGTTVTNNDYVFVSINYSTTTDVDEYRRFKYSDASNGSWAYEYTLNNSSFTQAQWDAINSAITSTKVGNYDTHIANTNNPHGVTKAQVGLGNVGNFLAVSTDANQGLTDTQKVNARANIGAGTYVKPNDGIPKTDLASGVQTSLGKADTAYQKPNGGIPDSDIASASTWNDKQDALPTTGTASTTYAINVSGKATTAGTADSANSVAWSNVSGKPTVDQSYNATSNNPQSGTAVAQAVKSKVFYNNNVTQFIKLFRIPKYATGDGWGSVVEIISRAGASALSGCICAKDSLEFHYLVFPARSTGADLSIALYYAQDPDNANKYLVYGKINAYTIIGINYYPACAYNGDIDFSVFGTVMSNRITGDTEITMRNMRDASWINSGTFDAARIPTSLPNVTAGTANNLRGYITLNSGVGAGGVRYQEIGTSPVRGVGGGPTTILLQGQGDVGKLPSTWIFTFNCRDSTPAMEVHSFGPTYSTIQFGYWKDSSDIIHFIAKYPTWCRNSVSMQCINKEEFFTFNVKDATATEPTGVQYATTYNTVSASYGQTIGGQSTPVYVDSSGQAQPCDPSQMTVGAASTVALRMDSPTYIDISWANVSWSDFCGAGANSLLQKVFGSNYDSVWRTITVIGRIEACPVDFEANTGISASAMNYGNFIGVKSRDAMFVKFFTNAKHNNGQYPIYEITFGLSASSGISGIRSIMKNVVISSATQSLPGGSGSATKPVYTDQRGELKPCSSELPNGYGTSGQYLKSNGANNAPSWDDTSNINAGSVNGYSIDVRIGGTPGSDPNTIYFC